MPEPPFDAFQYAHARYHEIAWMCQNTNHLVPREAIEPALIAAVRDRRYPTYPLASGDPELIDLVRRALGTPPGFTPSLTGGGTEALYVLLRALLGPGDEFVASDPSYFIIHRFAELTGAKVRTLPIYQPPYRLTSEQVQEAIGPKTRMILLIDPLNPMGSTYPREEVRAIAEIAHDRHLLLLNDVTYRDFADRHALGTEFAPEETIVVWSVSKNCGLAGLRLGGLVATPELQKKIVRFSTSDLGQNVLSQVAAKAAMSSRPQWLDHVRRQTRANGDRIRETVAQIPGSFLPVFPSSANMFVIDIARTGVDPEDLQKELLVRYGVFIRSGYYLSHEFGSRFVRVSFSNPTADIDRFVEAFPKAMAALRPASAHIPA
jgi:aspartate/methionine/tyrosine aminotransferase